MSVLRPTALTFDCYGTLIDWERGILEVLRPWLARHGQTRGDDAVLEAFGRAESAREQATPTRLYRDLLADVHGELARQWAIAEDAAEARAFGDSVGSWPAFPDSPEALAALKRRYRLVILSNVDRASFAKSNARLGVVFDHVFTAEDIGSYKPSPRNFAYMIDRLAVAGIGRGEILHCAQSLFHDIEPASAAGLPTVWVNRRRGRAGSGATPPASATPDREVASLAELAELLGA